MQISSFFQNIFSDLYLPDIRWNDIAEIIIMAYVIYRLIRWLKNTKAWSMLKGVAVIIVIVLIAYLFNMRTITWLVMRTINVALVAFVILLQPEIRHALEKLGRRVFNSVGFKSAYEYERFSEDTMTAVVEASVAMGAVKTGALIVIEGDISLNEYISTGIDIDARVSKQLLINIFEKDTPLHDGAVIIRGDTLLAATCYLPMTREEGISKDLGTRHRAAIGVSQEYDCITVVVSEETGAVSVTFAGRILRRLTKQELTQILEDFRTTPGLKDPIGNFLARKD